MNKPLLDNIKAFFYTIAQCIFPATVGTIVILWLVDKVVHSSGVNKISYIFALVLFGFIALFFAWLTLSVSLTAAKRRRMTPEERKAEDERQKEENIKLGVAWRD